MIEYRGYYIDILDTNVFISGNGLVLNPVPKREGAELISEAERLIDERIEMEKSYIQ